MITLEVISFLELHEQRVDLVPLKSSKEDSDYLIIKEQQLAIVIHNLSPVHNVNVSELSSHFRIIHLWEDAWKTSNEIVKSRLRSAIGKSVRLPGRVMKVKRIDKPTADAFLNKHHLQGSPKAKFKYGLFLPKNYYRLVEDKTLINESADETLLAVATFAAPKTYYRENNEKSRSIELIHFSNHSAFTVIGGLNKLLKFLEKEQKPDDIMTYVDADWSDGKAFEKIGFKRTGKISPIALYVHKDTYERYRHLPESESPDNYVTIYNSGSWKMIWQKT